jgi:plasmid stabilization system protein ParE
MIYEVKLLKRAVADIEDICRYLSQFYPGTCRRFLDELERSMDNLMRPSGPLSDKNGFMGANAPGLIQNPYMYSEYEKNKAYRRIVVQRYLVFYKVFKTAKTVRVYRILYGQRNIAGSER